jgi:AcrR family transcriptional regulator
LVVAAGELFYRRGVAATGVDAVLQRARVAPATMYRHFPGGKDAIVAEYLRRSHETWRQMWDATLEECSSAEDRALSVFNALLQYRESGYLRGCIFLSAAVELPADHPGRRWLAADSELLRHRIEALVGALEVPDPKRLSHWLIFLYDGALADGLRQDRDPPASVAVVLQARAAAAALIDANRRTGDGPRQGA